MRYVGRGTGASDSSPCAIGHRVLFDVHRVDFMSLLHDALVWKSGVNPLYPCATMRWSRTRRQPTCSRVLGERVDTIEAMDMK